MSTINKKRLSKLPNKSTFMGIGGFETTTSESKIIISQSLRFKIVARKTNNYYCIDAVVIMNIKNGDVQIVSSDNLINGIISTNMFDIRDDISYAIEAGRRYASEKEDTEAEKCFIRATILKHVYIHFAPLFTELDPERKLNLMASSSKIC